MDNKSKKNLDIRRQTVNSSNKYINTVNSQTVGETVPINIQDQIQENNGGAHYMAQLLAEGLDDLKSERFYYVLAQNIEHGILYEALQETKTKAQQGKIRRNKAVYFRGILINKGCQTKFRRED